MTRGNFFYIASVAARDINHLRGLHITQRVCVRVEAERGTCST